MDAVWENVIVQVGNIRLQTGNTLDQQIAIDEQRAKLEKEIARLEKLAWAEKQPKKKFELVQKINDLKRMGEWPIEGKDDEQIQETNESEIVLKNDNVESGDELHDIFSSAMACMAKPLIPESTLSSFVQSGSQLQTALTVVQSDQLKSLVRQLSFIDTGASVAAKLTNNIFDSALFNPNIELNLRIPQYDF